MSDDTTGVRVWWVPQVPGPAFKFPVPDIATGALLCGALASYDQFQYENRIKPDYCNAGGLSYIDEDGDWCDVDPDDPFEVEYAEAVLKSRSRGADESTADKCASGAPKSAVGGSNTTTEGACQ